MIHIQDWGIDLNKFSIYADTNKSALEAIKFFKLNSKVSKLYIKKEMESLKLKAKELEDLLETL